MVVSTLPPEPVSSVAEGLAIDRAGAILRLRLDRPAARNALTPSMYDGMRGAIEAASEDGSIKAILVTASGPSFCAGNDAAGFDLVRHLPRDERPGYRFMKTLLDCPKPLVAAVAGNAVGIGATMLLHFDLVYCTPGTRFHLPFTRLGLVPEFASSYLLPRMAGHARAARWLLLGDPMEAADALDIGLVTALVADETPDAHALSAAERLAALPASAVQASRALMRAPNRRHVAEIMATEMDRLSEQLASDETRGLLARLAAPDRK